MNPADNPEVVTTYPGPPVETIISVFCQACGITDTEWPNIEVFYDYDHRIIEVEVESVVYHSPMDDSYTFTKQTSVYPDIITVPHDNG